MVYLLVVMPRTHKSELLVYTIQLGLGISDKKIILRKTESTEEMAISDGIPAVPRNRNLSEFRSGPFRGRENNSEFRSVEQK
jgi:hypothetical protein